MRSFGIVCKSGKEEKDERVKETKNPEISSCFSSGTWSLKESTKEGVSKILISPSEAREIWTLLGSEWEIRQCVFTKLFSKKNL